MMVLLFSALVLLPLDVETQAQGQGVESVPEARLVEVSRHPEAPAFGEVFELSLTLRLAPGFVAFVPDTLVPTAAAASAAPGEWRTEPAPGDSTDIVARYPVVGYREALIEYPWIELGFGPAGPGDDGAAVRSASEAGAATGVELDTRLLRLGGVTLEPLAPASDGLTGLSLRPPAGVLGADWSPWFIVAASLGGLLVLLGGGLAGSRWWRSTLAPALAQRQKKDPRRLALQELDRIRDSGLHRNGRIELFYRSTTDTLRSFLRELEPDWGPDLTSTELMTRLDERWTAAELERLASAVATAERVKFGRHLPSPEVAEGDWAVVREWIREAPEA